MKKEESFIRLLGYNGKYLISDYGRVYSADKHGFLPEFEMKDGSVGVHLEWNGRKYAYAVDKLMVNTFFTVPEWAFEEPLVDIKHIDGNLGNNRIDNLYPYYNGDTYWDKYVENKEKKKPDTKAKSEYDKMVEKIIERGKMVAKVASDRQKKKTEECR